MTSPFPPSNLAFSHRHALASGPIGETFQIDVALPAAPPPPEGWPVIYLMDANTVFGIAAETLRFLAADGVPPALLVGVGYQLGGPVRRRRDYGRLRARDLTPSLDQGFADRLATAEDDPTFERVGPAGGADAFLAFLIEELRPFIAKTYSTNLEDQTLVGSSLGGLFCLHALFTRPGAFQRHIANSPAIWWDDRRLLVQERRFAEAVLDRPIKLFLSVGGLETLEPWGMVDDMVGLADRLSGYPGLILSRQVFEEESHTSVIPGALSRGLRSVFA